MPQNNRTILSTRPLEQVIIDQAAASHIMIEVVSFIHTEKIAEDALHATIADLLEQSLTVLFTSMNAVEAVAALAGETKPDWKIYCIGSTTRLQVAEKWGAAMVAGTADSAKALAERVIRERDERPLVFFCGDQRREELPMALAAKGIPLKEIVVYKTIETSHPLTGHYDAVLFYSPSAVRSFFASNQPGEACTLFAIGSSTAEAIRTYSSHPIVVAAHPSKAELAKEAIEYLKTDTIHHGSFSYHPL